MQSSEWADTLAAALTKKAEENDRRAQFVSHQAANPEVGPWDAWGGSICRTVCNGAPCLIVNATGVYLYTVDQYRRWRENSGYGYGKRDEICVEWAYLIAHAPERYRHIWSIESADEILLWDAHTGTWCA